MTNEEAVSLLDLILAENFEHMERLISLAGQLLEPCSIARAIETITQIKLRTEQLVELRAFVFNLINVAKPETTG